jgi:hypothetical protein
MFLLNITISYKYLHVSAGTCVQGNVFIPVRLVVGLSHRRHGFAPGLLHVRIVVDKVALGQVFLRVLRFSLSV